MAKSLRSKWKRKMKAEKRVKYEVKERARLEKMLGQFEEEQKEKAKAKDDTDAVHAPQMLGSQTQKDSKSSEDAMETAPAEGEAFSSRSLRCAKGSHPVWVSNRKIQQMKAKKVKPEGKVNKRHKKKFL